MGLLNYGILEWLKKCKIIFFINLIIRASFNECTQSANTIAFDKSGVVLSAGYDDSQIRIFNTRNLKYDTKYPGHEDAILDLVYDPNNKFLVSCSADKTFRIWQ